ncbi:hypothetical protein GCM10010912_07770 [Paenibacillus albidus]|uniref:DUF4367 domain-containing protein n=1 Tax=Paenibacillus albidus TaxID=2041023 RepID=A0A917C1C7_9BACL|nr:DUF4367 domain-containing protein [Paenibacillus albidus]GGF65203.1 hypothetical protein GCM10010912_07770 [Paenibacillus albidus]
MCKIQYTAEEQLLRNYDQSADVESIDVRQPVMKAIADKYGDNHVHAEVVPKDTEGHSTIMTRLDKKEAGDTRRRPVYLRRIIAYSTALLVALSIGATYYVHTAKLSQSTPIEYRLKEYEPIEDPGTSFSIKLEEIKPEKASDEQIAQAVKQNEKYQQAKQWVEKQLLPGERAFFLVGQDLEKNAKTGMAVQPLYFDGYSAFSARQTELNAPALPEPRYIPSGYAFTEGQILPETSIISALADSTGTAPGEQAANGAEAYQRLIEEMATMKATELGGNYKLVWKRLPKAGTESVKVTYTSDSPDEQKITIQATYYAQKTMASFNTWGIQKVDNVTVNGKEFIYMRAAPQSGQNYAQQLLWLDPIHDTYYTLSDTKGSPLSQEQMIKIAVSMTGIE